MSLVGDLTEMREMRSVVLGVLVVACAPVLVCSAAEPQWTSQVVKRGEDRAKTNSTDILHRPNRPLHFYGNTVRRVHYRGQARPTVRDMQKTVVHLIER